MKIGHDAPLLSPVRLMARRAVKLGAGVAVMSLVAYSAVVAKEARSAPLLASVSAVQSQVPIGMVVGVAPASVAQPPALVEESGPTEGAEPEDDGAQVGPPEPPPVIDPLATDPNVRWFNGRPIKPVKVVTMVVTAYSPDSRSCGDSADGITATLHSVETNGFRLVAADPTVLPYGTMITVPGYDSDRVVPVLDCGGAIKGKRLDVLFPTHEAARKWGVRKVQVTVWGYIDGKPAENPRKVR